MKECFICRHSSITPGSTDRILRKNGTRAVVTGIPCLVCTNCGEVYLETGTIEALENVSFDAGTECAMVNYPGSGIHPING